MTDTKRSLLSVASGLLLATAQTIAGFSIESEHAKSILFWPARLLYRWIGINDPTGHEGTPVDGLIGMICILVGSLIILTIYSFLTYVVLNLITKSEE